MEAVECFQKHPSLANLLMYCTVIYMQQLLGAHVSIAGGIDKAIDHGTALGATAIQTFASSPRTLAFKPIDPEIIAIYNHKKSISDIKCHVFHGIYLINLAHENPTLRQMAIDSLVAYQNVAHAIGGLGTVFHTGSHKGAGLQTVLPTVVASLQQILEQSPPEVSLMLENTAGQGGAIGESIEQLASIFDALEKNGVNTDNLGIGLDTQHAFASGVPIHTADGLENWLSEIQDNIGLNRLKVLHLNDSLPEFATKRDRHANLGEGNIGLEAFKRIVNRNKLKHLPMILEVPGENKSGPRKEDVQQLQSLIG
jgi:deoxyribonuclease-4